MRVQTTESTGHKILGQKNNNFKLFKIININYVKKKREYSYFLKKIFKLKKGKQERRVLSDSLISFLLEVGDEKNIKYKI